MNLIVNPDSDVNLVDYEPSEPPRLVIVIDTEEEFDWSKPHSRSETSVDSIDDIPVVQRVFDWYGIIPCYVVDYPIVTNDRAASLLAGIKGEQRCEIGAHLHPWVTPPYSEELVRKNTFPGNLSADVEFAKLSTLTEEIANRFGSFPAAYKAGRYGIGQNTEQILLRLGYKIDLSPTPGFSYSMEEGPDFRSYPNAPYVFGATNEGICIPCTGSHYGPLYSARFLLERLGDSKLGHAFRTNGFLSRGHLLERARLSPEGFALGDLIALTKFLFGRGLRTFTLSFHSPSVRVGCTPYVRSRKELATFIDRIDQYLKFFKDEMKGVFSTPFKVGSELLGKASASCTYPQKAT